MVKQCVMFTFSQEQIQEPVVYNLGQQFNLSTNIRRAALSEQEGWVVLELEGKEADIEQAIVWATSRGVRVESVNEDIAEG